MLFRFLQIFPSWRLFAAQPGKPQFVRFERGHQRLNLAQLAALRGIAAVQDAELRFLLRHSLLRNGVHDIERPFARHAIAIFVSAGEMIAGIEKHHGNIGDFPAQ